MLLDLLGISLQQFLTGLLTVTQIVFYVGTGIVVYLSYQTAKKGLLNPSYAEYHKQVIARLKEISEELDSEFDPNSPNYWPYQQPMKPEVDRINAEFEANKEVIRKESRWRRNAHHLSNRYQRTTYMARSVKTDPLIPSDIRNDIVKMLKERAFALSQAEVEALQQYEQKLAQGEGGVNFNKDNLEHNWTYVQGLVSSRLHEVGYDEQQTEQRIEDIRLKIQKYPDSFSPIR